MGVLREKIDVLGVLDLKGLKTSEVSRPLRSRSLKIIHLLFTFIQFVLEIYF